jgi:hypothetical protein
MTTEAPASSPPTPARAAPLFGVIAIFCAIAALFFPRFLFAMPVLGAFTCGAVSLFRRERWPLLAVVAMVGAAGLLVLIESSGSPGRNTDALADITLGHTVGGALHPGRLQFVCFDEADALRGERIPGTESVEGAQDAVEKQLIAEERCTYTDSNASFDMTADGKERFTTPHGVIEMWATPD